MKKQKILFIRNSRKPVIFLGAEHSRFMGFVDFFDLSKTLGYY